MPLRNAMPFTFRGTGVTDTADASNNGPGSFTVLTNLVPAPGTPQAFVPRPASEQETDFTGFSTPAGVTALLVVGTRAYGMIASAAFAGKDEPFCFDITAGTFVAITGTASANLPTTQATSGDWTPPTMDMVANRILVTHPGFTGSNKVGWIDITSFSSNTITGTTHTSTLIDTLSSSPITAGWQVGDVMSGTGVVAGTRIVSMTATSVTLDTATTSGGAGVTLTVVGGTSAAPVWGAGNTNTNALSALPKAVKVFNGRAYYAVNNTLVYSDALNPLQVTNATQALTLGDNQDVTALGGLPLNNVVAGGVIQSLIAFKGASAVFQITGDQATSNLSSNVINGAPGTLAPLTVCGTPLGLSYVAPDGLRVIALDASTTPEAIGAHGTGVTIPFSTAVHPSRMCAAFNASKIRISCQNGTTQGQPFEEWWYDIGINVWTGPHSFPASHIQPYFGGNGQGFILSAVGVDAKLFSSQTDPELTSTFTENGTDLTWTWQPSLMPDNESMSMNAEVETTLMLALPDSQLMTITAMNEQGAALDQVGLDGSGSSGALWGTGVWGVMVWGGATVPMRQYQIRWTKPLVYKQSTLRVTGASTFGFVIGNLRRRMQQINYLIGAPA